MSEGRRQSERHVREYHQALARVRQEVERISRTYQVSIPSILREHIVFTQFECDPVACNTQRIRVIPSNTESRLCEGFECGNVKDVFRLAVGNTAIPTVCGIERIERETAGEETPSIATRGFAPTLLNKTQCSTVPRSVAESAPGDLYTTTGEWIENFTFGVELEVCLHKTAAELLMDSVGKILKDIVPELNDRLRSCNVVFKYYSYQDSKLDTLFHLWKVTTDQSICSEDGRSLFGMEMISPILHGMRGIEETCVVADTMNKMAFSTNGTTAMHVHVNCQDLSNEQLRRFAEYAIVYENVIDLFMAMPRRKDYNRYCRSNLKSISYVRNIPEALEKIRRLDLSKSVNPLVQIMCPKLTPTRHSGRNHKLNFLTLRGTKRGDLRRRIECRQHHGSTDSYEIACWVRLMIRWIYVTSNLPHPPPAEEGQVAHFWKIIDNSDLEEYFSMRAQTLPQSMEFTYETRELFGTSDSLESDDENDRAEEDPSPLEDRSQGNVPLTGSTTTQGQQCRADLYGPGQMLAHQIPTNTTSPCLQNRQVTSSPGSRIGDLSHMFFDRTGSTNKIDEKKLTCTLNIKPIVSKEKKNEGPLLTLDALASLEGKCLELTDRTDSITARASTLRESHSRPQRAASTPETSLAHSIILEIGFLNLPSPFKKLKALRLYILELLPLGSICLIHSKTEWSGRDFSCWTIVSRTSTKSSASSTFPSNVEKSKVEVELSVHSPLLGNRRDVEQATRVACALLRADFRNIQNKNGEEEFEANNIVYCRAHVMCSSASNLEIRSLSEIFVRFEETWRDVFQVVESSTLSFDQGQDKTGYGLSKQKIQGKEVKKPHRCIRSNTNSVRQHLRAADQDNLFKVVARVECTSVHDSIQELVTVVNSPPHDEFFLNIQPCSKYKQGNRKRRIVLQCPLGQSERAMGAFVILMETFVSRARDLNATQKACLLLSRDSTQRLFFDHFVKDPALLQIYGVQIQKNTSF